MRIRAQRSLVVLVSVAAVAALSSCQATSQDTERRGSGSTSAESGKDATEKPTPVRLTTNLADTGSVPVDTALTVSTDGAALSGVRLASADGDVAGEVADGTWSSSGRLEPGTDYVITATSQRDDGSTVERTRRFHTADLTLAEQTYPSIAPLGGETVGVGMPVIVTFDVPVTDRATFERHMTVTSAPRQRGSWYWLSDQEAHWRPMTYWKPGTDVTVNVDVNSLPAGKGVYGQESRQVDFHVGDSHVYKVNAQTHQMQVLSNGKLLRTIPITTGKPGFTTRSGTKVIIEKFAEKRMNSETVGINRDDPEAYDIDDVQWAMRLTYSGEFVHAAPWSVSSQGYANVSHGCTGMSTADAGWLYAMSRRGDVVEYTGTDRSMTLENGYGDWNLPPADWKAGSALS